MQATCKKKYHIYNQGNQTNGDTKMNLKKSIRVMLAKNEWNLADLALRMGISAGRMGVMVNQNTVSSKTLEKLAAVFDMKLSEFIALGE